MKIDWLPEDFVRPNLFGIDPIRGLSAVLVLLFHWYGFWFHGNSEFVDLFGLFRAGHIGVDFFFVLSGLLIFLSLVSGMKKPASLGTYFKRRFLRVVPLALVVLGVMFWFKQDFSGAAWTDLWIHFSFTQSLWEAHYHGAFPVMWTLTVEILFYLALPIVVYAGRKKLWHFLLILLGVLVVNFFYRYAIIADFENLNSFQRIFVSEQLWGRADQFILGICLGLITIFRGKFWNFLNRYRHFFLVFGFLGTWWGVWMFADLGGSFREFWYWQVFLHFLLGLAFTVLLAGVMVQPREKLSWLGKKLPFMSFLGKISYGVYLWHFFFLELCFAAFPDQPWVSFVIALSLTILYSSISWYWIEKPFLRLKI